MHQFQTRNRRALNRFQLRCLESRAAPSVVPVGGEFQVNTYTTHDQLPGQIVMDQDGDFIVTWYAVGDSSNISQIYAQRFDSTGQPQGSEILVNSNTTSHKKAPTVAMDQDGDFVVAWTSYGQDGQAYSIWAQRFNQAGVKQGAEFRVNTATSPFRKYASAGMDQDGDFVIVYTGSPVGGVVAQRYDKDGTPLGVEYEVLTGGYIPSIAMNPAGQFIVAATGDDGSNYGVFARRYNPAGVPQGTEFRVNTYTTDYQWIPSVAMDQDGDFVVAWISYGQDGSGHGVYAKRYNSAGTQQGIEFRVNTYTFDHQVIGDVPMDLDGNFVIAWTSDNQDGSNRGVYAKAYRSNGLVDAAEFRVNTYTTHHQSGGSVAINQTGNFVVSWGSIYQDGDFYGVYAQRYKLTGPPRISNYSINDGSTQRSRVTDVKITFNSPVTLPANPANAFQLKRQSDNAMIDLNASVTGNTVTLTFAPGSAVESGSLADGRYTLTALAAQINGGNFDGNGNGIPGDNYQLLSTGTTGVFRLFGDADGNATVNAADFATFRTFFGVGASIFDFNNDGQTNSDDFAEFRKRFGIMLVP